MEQTPKRLNTLGPNVHLLQISWKGCSNVIYQLPLSIQGWQFTSAVCDGAQVLSSYKRSAIARPTN